MLKVMLVDDEHMALEGLQILIDWQKHGFSVCALCLSGEEALAQYEAAQPDLVVTDLYMPSVDGIQLMERLRARGYAGQFLIVSGFSDFDKAQKALKHSVADYLLKPIDTDEADIAISRIKLRLTNGGEKARAHNTGALTQDIIWEHTSGIPDAALSYALSSKQERLSDTVKRHANARISESLTLEALADQMGYNAAYLGRVFKEETGKSFRMWLSENRITRAAAYLKTSDTPIRDIAAQVGYRKYQNFLEAFKTQYHLSPQAYRKQERTETKP